MAAAANLTVVTLCIQTDLSNPTPPSDLFTQVAIVGVPGVKPTLTFYDQWVIRTNNNLTVWHLGLRSMFTLLGHFLPEPHLELVEQPLFPRLVRHFIESHRF